MLQTLIDQKTVKPGNWSSLTVFLWFQLSKMGISVLNGIIYRGGGGVNEMRRHVPHKLRRQTAAYRKIPTNCRIFNRLRESAAVKIPLISLLSLCNENFDQTGV